jgi:hypothetical protein
MDLNKPRDEHSVPPEIVPEVKCGLHKKTRKGPNVSL